MFHLALLPGRSGIARLPAHLARAGTYALLVFSLDLTLFSSCQTLGQVMPVECKRNHSLAYLCGCCHRKGPPHAHLEYGHMMLQAS